MGAEKLLFLIVGLSLIVGPFLIGITSAEVCLEHGNLKAELCDGVLSTIDITSDKLYCESSGRHWINTSGTYSSLIYNLPNELGCYQEIIADGSKRHYCCPSGSECETGNHPSGKIGLRCIVSKVHNCRNYTNEDSCNGDIANVGIQSVELSGERGEGFCSEPLEWINSAGDSCYKIKDCRCEWNTSTNICSQRWNDINAGGSPTCTPSSNGCIETLISIDDTGCQFPGGVAIYTYTSTPIGTNPNPPCLDGKVEIPCSKLTRLPFFDYLNLIEAIGIIFISYTLIYISRLKRKFTK